MFLKILLKLLTSEMTKRLIGYAIQKLLEHKEDGVTKDVIKMVIDGAIESKANSLSIQDVLPIKKLLGI